MYLDTISIRNFRVFRDTQVTLVHPDREWTEDLPKPKLLNINLLLGNNGLGKSTMLKAIALAVLGPAVSSAGLYPYHLVREEPGRKAGDPLADAAIGAAFIPHPQDEVAGPQRVDSRVVVARQGDLETLRWEQDDQGAKDERARAWDPIFSASSAAFFVVGYGATRRVERRSQYDSATRTKQVFARAQRIQSLFEDAYSLIPTNAWLPAYETKNPGRFKQVVHLLNDVVSEEQYRFTGELEEGEYLFEREGLRVPFPALSDGYQAFLGWVGDLLYHVCETCPSGHKLAENHGIVMVDEIDLHLHPKWQMTILPTLSRVLPNIQFIVTSHSPLVVGSLEWMNLLVMQPEAGQASCVERIEHAISGLDADQVLLTDFFGLETTRAPEKSKKLRELTLKARDGDTDAAIELMKQMSRGTEGGA